MMFTGRAWLYARRCVLCANYAAAYCFADQMPQYSHVLLNET